jgi:hypothetical protein
MNFLPALAWNEDPPDLYHLKSWDYKHKPQQGLCV